MRMKLFAATAAVSSSLAIFLVASSLAVHSQPGNGNGHGNGGSTPPGHSAGKGHGNNGNHGQSKKPILVEKMGSIFAGGDVITAPGTWDPTVANPFGTPDGQSLHVDHVYAQYKIPAKKKKDLPLVMWHGCLSPAWESTPDGREGYESIFLRRGFSTYVIDWPRMGRSGKSSEGVTITPRPNEYAAWNSWRLGVWPDLFPDSQFPGDAASLDHFFRQGGNNNGPSNNDVSTDAVAALFDKIGPSVLITHSASGYPGLVTAIKSSNVKAIVAYEPNEGVFPPGEAPEPMANAGGQLMVPKEVSAADFEKLTQIPIQIIFSDYIPSEPDASNVARDNWRVRMANNQAFVDLINAHGGDAELIVLPEIGIHGNSHFAFTDRNNVEIADLLSSWLHDKGLDD